MQCFLEYPKKTLHIEILIIFSKIFLDIIYNIYSKG